jgi:RHS repeat-associated protein
MPLFSARRRISSIDPFGNILSKSGPLADANIYRFSSQEYHQPSGLSLYLYRAYDPNLQRWLSRDPIGERGGANLYGFVGNSPQNYLDPLGLDFNVITAPISISVPCCAEKDKVTIGLIVRGKYSEGHNPGVMAQHADATLADGSLVGFFGTGGGLSGFGMKGVVADKAWFDANRPYYNNADLAKKHGVVSTYCTLKVCPDAAKKFADAWNNMGGSPPNFSIMGGNCSSRAGGCFQSAGILDSGIGGLDTPNHLFEDLKAKYGSSLKCRTGFFGYNPSGNPYVIPLPPGAPTSPNTKNTSDVTVSQGTPSSN